jgi:cytochrome b involved in lipid metabolism
MLVAVNTHSPYGMGCKQSMSIDQPSPGQQQQYHSAATLAVDPAAELSSSEASARHGILLAYTESHPFAAASIANLRCDSPTKNMVLVILHGSVYDCTHFATVHPGGPYILLKNRGTDMAVTFDRIHSRTTKTTRLPLLRVGPLMSPEQFGLR